MSKVDLHLHTNLSDGLISPEDVVIKAKNNDCKIISITDHELLNEYDALAKKYNIDIISGIEFNTSISNLHLLGYAVKNFKLVDEVMQNLRIKNERVCLEVIELLKKDGFVISETLIKKYLQEINLDYSILDKRKLVKYLMYMGYTNSIVETYETLIGKKQKYYVPNVKLSPEEIINLIDQSGNSLWSRLTYHRYWFIARDLANNWLAYYSPDFLFINDNQSNNFFDVSKFIEKVLL